MEHTSQFHEDYMTPRLTKWTGLPKKKNRYRIEYVRTAGGVPIGYRLRNLNDDSITRWVEL